MKRKSENPFVNNAHRGAFAALRAMQSEELTVAEAKAAMALADYLLNWTPLNGHFNLSELEEMTAGLAEDMLSSLSQRDNQ